MPACLRLTCSPAAAFPIRNLRFCRRGGPISAPRAMPPSRSPYHFSSTTLLLHSRYILHVCIGTILIARDDVLLLSWWRLPQFIRPSWGLACSSCQSSHDVHFLSLVSQRPNLARLHYTCRSCYNMACIAVLQALKPARLGPHR